MLTGAAYLVVLLSTTQSCQSIACQLSRALTVDLRSPALNEATASDLALDCFHLYTLSIYHNAKLKLSSCIYCVIAVYSHRQSSL